MPGVLPVPEEPTTAAQVVIGCVHDRDAIARRAVPIRLELFPTKEPPRARGSRRRHGLRARPTSGRELIRYRLETPADRRDGHREWTNQDHPNYGGLFACHVLMV